MFPGYPYSHLCHALRLRAAFLHLGPAIALSMVLLWRESSVPSKPSKRTPANYTLFGAPSHSLSAPCLRFVLSLPQATQDSVLIAGQHSITQVSHLMGIFNEFQFQVSLLSSPSFQGFSCRYG